jgi:hypothetical protein
MASEIIYATIDETYPIAGQDNDTQGFRDNFNVVKQGLKLAQEEITDLQNNTAGLALSAITGGSNFNQQIVSNAKLKGNIESLVSAGDRVGEVELNFSNGNYQVFKATAGDISFNVIGFPADEAAKVTVEILGDDTERTVTFSSSDPGIVTFKRANFPSETLTVTSSSDPVIIEIYTRKKNTEPGLLPRSIFLNYIGLFE